MSVFGRWVSGRLRCRVCATLSHDLIKGLLLENHGVLAFSGDARGAAQANIIIEETAQLALYAEALGGPTILTLEKVGSAIQRRDDFAARGTQSAT